MSTTDDSASAVSPVSAGTASPNRSFVSPDSVGDEQRERRRRLAVVIGGGAVLLGLFVAASIWGIAHIEDDLEREARQLLRSNDIDVDGADGAGLTFQMNGRSIEVSGDVSSVGEALRIDDILTHQRGLRDADVTGLMIAAAATTSAQVQIVVSSTDPRTITLSGTVPDEAARQHLLDAAAAGFGADNVIDELEVTGLGSAPGTQGAIDQMVSAIGALAARGVAQGTVSLSGTDLTVTALVDDEATEAAIAAAVSSANLDITVLEIEAGIVRMDFEVDDGLIRLNDTVLTQSQRDVLINAAADASGIDASDVAADISVSGLAEAIPGSDDRIAQVAGLFPTLVDTSRVLRATGSLDGEDLTIDAVVTSQAAGTTLTQAVEAVGGTVTLTVEETAETPDAAAGLNEAFADLNLRLQEVVAFDIASAVLTAEAAAIIDEAIVAMNEFPDPVVTVSGHSSRTGAASINLTLSQQRAEAVLAYLVFSGIDVDRLTAEGRGITDMLPDVDDTDERQQRVQFEAFSP